MRAVVLIPAYMPGESLVDVTRSLAASPDVEVVVVDDGSGPAYDALFAEVRALPHTTFLQHAVNLGKGAALKTGLNYIACRMPGRDAIVTADADGQHLVDDILTVARKSAEEQHRLVLGVRRFQGPVPLRCRIGNTATRSLMKLLVGLALSDTQTGLRGVPYSLIPMLLPLKSTRYEFELEMLIHCKRRGIRITEVPIQTVYEADNRSSHFNPIMDSIRVYLLLFRFTMTSLLSAIVDTGVFWLFFRATASILGSQIAARTVSVGVNYLTVRAAVFQTRQSHTATFPKYLLLVLVSGAVSYGLIRLFVGILGVPVIVAKVLAETIVFFANFAIQRDLIFRPHHEQVPAG